jgi:uncharacterized protein YjcR
MARRTPIMRTATDKLRIIEEANAEGAVQARICEKYDVSPGLVYTWKQKERVLRKKAEKEAKTTAKAYSNGHANGLAEVSTNGHANGAALGKAPEGPPKLFITGLAAMVKELVKAEVDAQLPVIVQRRLDHLVSAGLGIAQENKTN